MNGRLVVHVVSVLFQGINVITSKAWLYWTCLVQYTEALVSGFIDNK